MRPIFAKILKKRDFVVLEIPASLCMIGRTINMAGSQKGKKLCYALVKQPNQGTIKGSELYARINNALFHFYREMASGTYGANDEDDDKYKISSDDDDDLPFKCVICKKTFTDPVVTKCKHYFCEKCALENYKKSQRCFACGAQTNGMFNPAKELIDKLKKYKNEGNASDCEQETESD